jgi:hypothetical protein
LEGAKLFLAALIEGQPARVCGVELSPRTVARDIDLIYRMHLVVRYLDMEHHRAMWRTLSKPEQVCCRCTLLNS